MKIVILNGSPKGDESVTMQYLLYIKKKHPEHEYEFLNVAQQIKILEKKEERLENILNSIKSADFVIWAFPLYVLLVCSQYKRFIELIFEKGFESNFKGKYTLALSTSIHYFDHTAQNYVHAICEDLDMKYLGYYPADSWDLLYPKKRKNWLLYVESLFNSIENKVATSRAFQPLTRRMFSFDPSLTKCDPVDPQSKKVLILSDNTSETSNVGRMVNRFRAFFADSPELVNIHEIDIKGPCTGCISCGYNHECIYEDKDEFTNFWSDKVVQSDILILAGDIVDRYLSSRWKLIFDRAFFNTHTPTLHDKQMGYILSGPLSQIPNLTQILQSYAETQDANFLGIVTDEFGSSENINRLLYQLAQDSVLFANSNFKKPSTFLGEGAKRIFRDDVYGRNRFVFLADHEYYKKHGIYDTFPQNDERAKKMNEKLIPLMKIDKVRKKLNLKQEFLRPFKRVIEDPKK